MSTLLSESHKDYLQALDTHLKSDLESKDLTVTKNDGTLRINNQVLIHLNDNRDGLIRISIVGGGAPIYGDFMLCNNYGCVDKEKQKNGKYASYGLVVLRIDTYASRRILDTVGEKIREITEYIQSRQYGGGKKRKYKSRKSKSRKGKSRKPKPLKAKSRKNN